MDKMKIYLSYSHIDKELAHKFHDYLQEHGFEIIWDENTIATGDDFNKKLKNALYKADIYLPIISENFQRSNFAREELLTAIGYNSAREYPRLFPYIVSGDNIPIDLSTTLCFMGTENIENDLIRIVSEINKIKGLILAEQDVNSEIVENLNISLEIYLKDVFTKLEKNERNNRNLAYVCYFISGLFLLAILPLIFRHQSSNLDEIYTLLTILGTIQNVAIIAVLAALSRFSFILGKSFMVESIRNGDRIHAISFGKFFIQAYGNKASRQEIREVLGEWNIDKGSSFYTQDAKEINPDFGGTLDLLKSYFDKK